MGRPRDEGTVGRDTVLVFDEGVGFNMSQLAPRTRIIADTYVPFRWKPGLCSTFCCCRSEGGRKKNNDLSHLIPDLAAITRRPRGSGMKNCVPHRTQGNRMCVSCFGIIQKFNCLTAISLNTDIRMFPNTFSEISY